MGAMGIPLLNTIILRDVRRHADDRAPRAQGGQPRRADTCGCSSRSCWASRSSASRPSSTTTRIRRFNLKLSTRRLRLDVLHADRLPRPARDDRRDHAVGDARSRAQRAISTPSTISRSRPRRGTGTSSTSSGCCCSCWSTGSSERRSVDQGKAARAPVRPFVTSDTPHAHCVRCPRRGASLPWGGPAGG